MCYGYGESIAVSYTRTKTRILSMVLYLCPLRILQIEALQPVLRSLSVPRSHAMSVL